MARSSELSSHRENRTGFWKGMREETVRERYRVRNAREKIPSLLSTPAGWGVSALGQSFKFSMPHWVVFPPQ